MATIIKIKEDLEIKGCYDCPFLEGDDEWIDDLFCGIYLRKHEYELELARKEVDCTSNDGRVTKKTRPDNCPIISITKDEAHQGSSFLRFIFNSFNGGDE